MEVETKCGLRIIANTDKMKQIPLDMNTKHAWKSIVDKVDYFQIDTPYDQCKQAIAAVQDMMDNICPNKKDYTELDDQYYNLNVDNFRWSPQLAIWLIV